MSAERGHIATMGGMIEDMEIDIRSNMDALYIQKTREVVNGIRKLQPFDRSGGQSFVDSLNAAVKSHGAARKVDSES